MDFKDIENDIKSFVDDEDAFIIENDGSALFSVGGIEFDIKISISLEHGGFFVEHNSQKIPYIKFLGQQLGQLSLFATKILDRRKFEEPFVDGKGSLIGPRDKPEGNCFGLLSQSIMEPLALGTKLVFITADAGHGKSVLLRKLQYEFAQKFLANEANTLFWHVDLKGRELVRLNEAIMYDLGELRISGLYYSSILTLLRRNLLVLAIDGFDELAAEIGGTVALGALSSLVSQMEDAGTLVAASRRTFFDTQDYLKRTQLINGAHSNICEFNELKLHEWGEDEAIDLLGYYYQEPKKVYSELLQELNNNKTHPLISRPFLLSKVISGMQELNCSPTQFIGQIDQPLEGVGAIVDAFLKREVDKWKLREKDTGKPYLTFDQHLELVSSFAQEMWESKRESISIEEMQLMTTILCEDWNIDEKTRPMIVEMVKSHAFLIPTATRHNYRKFEHEEFRNYFLAKVLEKLLLSGKESRTQQLRSFLYVSQLPDQVSLYTFNQIPRVSIDVHGILDSLKELIANEWKPTYLQINIGTIIPNLLDGFDSGDIIRFSEKVTFSSIIFENKSISSVEFSNSIFINISLRATQMKNVQFCNCTFTELRIHNDSGNDLSNVLFDNCRFDSLVVLYANDIEESFFAPARINEKLREFSIQIQGYDELDSDSSERVVNPEFKKAVIKILNHFRNTTVLYQKNIREDGFWAVHRTIILEEAIPLLLEFRIISLKDTKASSRIKGDAWGLNFTLNEVFSADSPDASGSHKPLVAFWKKVNSHL